MIPPAAQPVVVYIASLAPDSRPAMISGLHAIARMVDSSATAYSLPWASLRFAHTKAVRAKLVERYGPRTVNRMLSAMRGVLKAAWNLEQMSTDDYMRAIQVKAESVTGLPPAGRLVPGDEIKKLLEAAALQYEPRCFRDQAMIVVLYAGGLRRQELAALDVIDYEAETGQIEVRRGKGRKYRTTYLAEDYRSWITPWLEFQEKRQCGPMFVRWHRHGPSMARISEAGVWEALGKICKRAGVDELAPHDLRRSFGTVLLDNGADLLMVQELMGHADVKTTKIYDRRGEKGKKKAVEKFPVVMRYEDFKRNR